MDQRYIDLYNHYVHGGMHRRGFLERLGVLAGGTAAASALLPILENDMAKAQTVSETDDRLVTETVAIPGVEGLSGYLARPSSPGPHPAVLVIHENRGLNAHIRDVTRRLALEGYIALGLDYLSPLGGTPADNDEAGLKFRELQPDMVSASGAAALAWLDDNPLTTGKVGAVGFCWGGGQVAELAVSSTLLDAGVPYYGRQPDAASVPAITAPLLIQYAGLDERINAGIPAFEAALKANDKSYEIHIYPGVNHGFNNDTSAARFDQATADLAWSRTLAFFKTHLI